MSEQSLEHSYDILPSNWEEGVYLKKLTWLLVAKNEYERHLTQKIKALNVYIAERISLLYTLKESDFHEKGLGNFEKFLQNEEISIREDEIFFRDIFLNTTTEIQATIAKEREDIITQLNLPGIKMDEVSLEVSLLVDHTLGNVWSCREKWESYPSLPVEVSWKEDSPIGKYYECLYLVIKNLQAQYRDAHQKYIVFCEQSLRLLENEHTKERVEIIYAYDEQSNERENDMNKRLLRNGIRHIWNLSFSFLSLKIITPSWGEIYTEEGENPYLVRMLNVMIKHFKYQSEKLEYAESMMQNFRNNFNQANFHALFYNKNGEEGFDEHHENMIAFVRIMNYGDPLCKERVIGSFFIEEDFRNSGIVSMLLEILEKEFTSGAHVIHMDVEPNSPTERLWKTYGFTFLSEKRMSINSIKNTYVIFHHYGLTYDKFIHSPAYAQHRQNFFRMNGI